MRRHGYLAKGVPMSETKSASAKQTRESSSRPVQRPAETAVPETPAVQRALVKPGIMRPEHILALQSTAGNRAVARLLANKSTGPAHGVPKKDLPGPASLQRQTAAARLQDWIPGRVQRVTEAEVISPPAKAGTSPHPTIQRGSPQRIAIKELQSRLNNAGLPGRKLAVDGIFGPKTHAKTVAFQTSKTIAPANGVVGADTWKELDKLPAVRFGQVEREWEEKVSGETFGMTSKFSWEITNRAINVTVKINFQRPADKNLVPASFNSKVQQSIGFITQRWNTFRAKKVGSADKRDIQFIVTAGGGTEPVELLKGNATSDAGHWYVGDTRFPNMVAHEFGHLIGLQDEYRLEEADYKRTHPGGALPAAPAVPAGFDAKAIATQLGQFLWHTGSPAGTATNANRGQKTSEFMTAKGLVQGENGTGQLVRKAYETQVYPGHKLVDDVNTVMGDVSKAADGASFQAPIIRPFTYTDYTSLMGSAYNVAGQERALILPQPRHLNEFVRYVQNYLGGEWVAERRP